MATAIIGAIAGGFAAAAGGMTIAGGALLGYSVATSYSNYKEAKEEREEYSFGPISNTKSHEIPIPVIYGENLVAGNVISQKIRGENDNLMDLQIGIGEGPIESISEIKANENNISANVQLGERIQTAWGENERDQTFPFLAHYSKTLNAEELEISSVPTMTAIVKGRKVRVWDGNQFVVEYSNNPVWCLMDFLTNERYGLNIDDDYIDFETFIEAAEYADEIVDGEKRFELDIVIDAKKSALDWITEILSTCRGFLFYSNGRLKIKIDRKEEAVQSFDMDNIIADSFSYSKTSRKERLKEVTVEYIEPEENYERITARFTDENMPLDSKRTISLLGVNRFSQAGRMARYFQKKSKYCTTTATWGAGIGDIEAEVGDVVLVAHEVPGWQGKHFRIIEIDEKENDEMQITGIEYNSAVYSDDGLIYQPSGGTSLPNPFAPPASVTNLSLIEQANVLGDGSWIPQIKVTFDSPGSMFWKYANIYISGDNGATWDIVTKTESTDYIIKELSPGTYKVRVQSENRRGRKEDFGLAATGQITVRGKDAPPSNVNWGSCDFDRTIKLRWQPITDIDLKAYEVRTDQNFGNDDGALIYRGDGLKASFDNPTRRQYTFFVKALDRSGNYSEIADEITLVNSAPSAPNFSADDITEFFSAIKIHVPQVSEARGYKIYVAPSDGVGNATGETEVIPLSTAQTINYNLNSGDSILVKIGTHDYLTALLDDENVSAEIEATAATIDNIAQFAADLRPPKIVDSLPVLPDNNYPLDSSVVYDGKLYINENGSWVSKVKEAETAVNALVAGTVEAGAIGVDELASAEAIIQKLGVNELIVDGHAQIRKATIDDSHLINVSATKIISDEMIADLMVSRGSITIKGNETEDVDSLAMMGMGPQKDKEIQNEWDAWEMSQDAIQGFDNNGNKQAELTNEGKIKLTDDEGNYALLDSDLLAFYEAGSLIPHYYTKRVAYGTAQDGDYIDLQGVDYRTVDDSSDGDTPESWNKAPKVMTSIKSLTSYNGNYDGDTQQYLSYVSSISKDGFYVHGRSVIPSGTEVLDNNYSNSVTWDWNGPNDAPVTFSGTYTSDWSNQSTVSNILADITFRVEPYPTDGRTIMDANWSLTIKYETDGGTVYTHDSVSGYESWFHIGDYITETLYSSAINIATSDDKYRLIVEWSLTGDIYKDISDYTPLGKPSIYINNQETKAEVIVDNGEVSWIAIEGGA